MNADALRLLVWASIVDSSHSPITIRAVPMIGNGL